MKKDKQALRRAVRERFPGPGARDRESCEICARVLAWPVYQRAKSVAGYMPLPWEADVLPILEDALRAGKTLLLPRVEDARLMTLRQVTALDGLAVNHWGLLEPSEDAPIAPAGTAELLLVPLEAVDVRGMRLGKGGGYYDRLLEKESGVTLGVALSWQRVEEVPGEPWDKPLDAVASIDGIQDRRGQ